MNIKELIKKNTNEEGVVDYASVQSQIDEDTQKQIGAVASKQKAKAKEKVEEVQQDVQTTVSEADTKYAEMQSQLSEMQAYFDQTKKSEFVKNAKANGLTDEQIEALDGVNYDTFDFTPFKQSPIGDVATVDEEVAQVDQDATTTEDDIANYHEMLKKGI